MTNRTKSAAVSSKAMANKREKPSGDEDQKDRLAIPLDPETALRALLKVDPPDPADAAPLGSKSGGRPGSRPTD
jgi:hypothetical protein